MNFQERTRARAERESSIGRGGSGRHFRPKLQQLSAVQPQHAGFTWIYPPVSPVPLVLLAGKGAVAGMASWCCWLGSQDFATCEISNCLARWFRRYLFDGEIA